jgi:hypothetical protein
VSAIGQVIGRSLRIEQISPDEARRAPCKAHLTSYLEVRLPTRIAQGKWARPNRVPSGTNVATSFPS